MSFFTPTRKVHQSRQCVRWALPVFVDWTSPRENDKDLFIIYDKILLLQLVRTNLNSQSHLSELLTSTDACNCTWVGPCVIFWLCNMGKTFESGPELKAAGQAQSREQLTWQASLHGSMSKGAGIYVQHLLSWKRSEILPVITLLSAGTASIMSSSCFIVFFLAVSAITWGSLARKICWAENEACEETKRECLTENNQLNKENLKFKVWEVKPDTTKPSSPKLNKVTQCLI